MNKGSISAGIEFVSASSRSILDDHILDLLTESIYDNGLPGFLYLSPTKRKNREMEMRLRNRRISWKPQFMVPTGLAQKILEDLPGKEFRWLRRELKILLVLKILDKSGEDGGLTTLRFTGVKTPMGVARHVVQAMDILSGRGLNPLDKTAGLPYPIAKDLDRVYAEYQSILNDHGLTDPVQIPLLAASALLKSEWSLPAPTNLLILDGFVAPDNGETEFLLQLTALFEAKRIVVTLPEQALQAFRFKDPDNLPKEFRLYRHGKRFFEGLGFHGDPLPSLTSSSTISVPSSQTVAIVRSYPDRAHEVKGIARTLKRLFFAPDELGNLRPEDFHIIVPRIESYYRLFIEIFPRYGIPFNITRGIPLASIPVVGVIQALMDAILKRDHLTLYRFFSSSLVTPPEPKSIENCYNFLNRFSQYFKSIIDPAEVVELTNNQTSCLEIQRLYRACRSHRVPGGRDIQSDWLDPLARSYSSTIISNKSSDDSLNDKLIRGEFATLLRELWLLETEFSAFDLVETGAKVESGLIGSLKDLINRYRLNENLIRSLAAIESEIPVGRQIIVEKNVKGFSRAMEVLAEIESDLEVAGETRPTIQRVREIFHDRCKKEMIQEAGELQGVSISQMLEIRNLVYPIVFMAGMTSNEFPLAPDSGFLVPGGPESPEFQRAMDESHFLLHHAITNSRRIELSYPTSDATDPLEPSPFLEDLLQEGLAKEDPELKETWAPYAAYELLEDTGRAWPEKSPVPWDKVNQLMAAYPLKSGDSLECFHDEIRRILTACLFRSDYEVGGLYDGMIREPKILDIINRMLDQSRFSYSAAMLNDYRRCPMAFFFKRILALAPVEKIPEEPEAAEIGTAVHEILARFYAGRRQSGLGRISPDNRVEALAELFQTADEVFSELDVLSGDRIEVWAVRQRIIRGLLTPGDLADPGLLQRVETGTDIAANRRGLLRILVDYEAEANMQLHPWSMEFAFGYGDYPPLIIDGYEGRHIFVRGKIDRVDLFGESPTHLSAAGWIFDYKTGRYPSLGDIKAGNDLQLPVYMLAALEVYGENPIEEVGACYLSLNIKEKAPRKAVLYTSGTPDELISGSKRSMWKVTPQDLEFFRSTIREIDRSIRNGIFPRSQTSSPCEYCDYCWACFRDEHRIKGPSEP